MAEPLTSGVEWMRVSEEIVPIGTTNLRWWVMANDGTGQRAVFKTPREAFSPSAMYALGMERVAYELGADLGLPIPPVHLETCEGHEGCVSLQAGGRNVLRLDWAEGRACRMNTNILNIDLWPLGVVFDVWIANFDREPAHILLDPVPPTSEPHATNTCTSWLIDHEKSGLWWPSKINEDAGIEVEKLRDEEVEEGVMPAAAELHVKQRMPGRYLLSLTSPTEEERDPILENVRRVTDDAIQLAVDRVPEVYMSEREKALTRRFLAGRRARIDNLVRDVCAPVPRR